MKFKSQNIELKTNLIPLINIIFIILIFFVILYSFSTVNFDEPGKNNIGDNKPGNIKNAVNIEVLEDGRLFIDNVETINSPSSIRNAIENPKEVSCILRINKNTAYKNVGKLIDNLEIIGVTKITFIKVSGKQ